MMYLLGNAVCVEEVAPWKYQKRWDCSNVSLLQTTD
jgi:hypothetical protein